MNRVWPLAVYFWLAVAFGPDVQGRGEEAVVRIPSHGGSGTVVATGPGWSLILSAAHMFEGPDRYRRLRLDVPSPTIGAAKQHGGSTVLAVWHREDLALIRLNTGPLPFVCPVAPAGWVPKRCTSCGYDRMQLPGRGPQIYTAVILNTNGTFTFTRESPWHGRSGGALIDTDAGYLIGVVSGYEMDRWQRPCKGIYSSHSAVLRLMAQHGMATAPQQVQPASPPGGC